MKNEIIFVPFKQHQMQQIEEIISGSVTEAIQSLYGRVCSPDQVQLQKTRREFEGDITLVVFPLLKISRKTPEQTASDIGEYLVRNHHEIKQYSIIKGFLNLVVHDSYYLKTLNNISSDKSYGIKTGADNGSGLHTGPYGGDMMHTGAEDQEPEIFMVEYSSPNTNKPLHLGHIRNNLLGYSVCNILKATGRRVIKTNLVNDRGIHICKSMLAWLRHGKGETPQSSGKKGDHLVGEYYVKFEQEYRSQISELIAGGQTQEDAERNAPLILEAQEMLRKWEAGDPEIMKLWRTMNEWVYEGFDETYRKLGVDFDKVYYESETWLKGKEIVLDGVKNQLFFKHHDGSVWVDLKPEGLDEKILLRSDGTSVYITQDIGTAQLRQEEYSPDKMIYVVGNEQNYHFKVLSIILEKLGFPWARSLHHLSYGMVELPEGRMKSREGIVVDADDLIAEMIQTAREMSRELGKLDGLPEGEKENICRIIGMGALKYYILKVDPVKNMTFNPRESIDFDGNTGAFIQYTYARIRSVFRKAEELGIAKPRNVSERIVLNRKEKNMLLLVHDFPSVIEDAARAYNPSLIANFTYELVREYNQFYHDFSILREKNTEKRNFRMALSEVVARVVRNNMGLLGIEMPERM
ncbi:MAG: arginine--tRNA ligase [Bacteroidales bacterium]|nr:arginine--tRNA ligase [Bacteroidales bacterium]